MTQPASLIVIIISSLISVAFYTILERKVLGYIQARKGPNKVGPFGAFQPFSDAIKLFSKSIMMSEMANPIFMTISPAAVLIFSAMILMFLPMSWFGLIDSNFSILCFFIISSLGVYSILIIGWSSNSKYCHLGSIRAVAQMISYEVALFLMIVSLAILSSSFSLVNFQMIQFMSPFILLMPAIFVMWVMICLAETNRSPFDFAEGESELVSGFNVEYMGGWFALIFLAEYLSMITLSMITTILFLESLSNFLTMPSIIFFSFIFLWIRGTFPRFRYDLLMDLNWKIFLPITTSFATLPLPFIFLSL